MKTVHPSVYPCKKPNNKMSVVTGVCARYY